MDRLPQLPQRLGVYICDCYKVGFGVTASRFDLGSRGAVVECQSLTYSCTVLRATTMSRRAVARAPRGGAAPGINVKEVDPRLTAVADWLRNEKKSGLHTKEAVQYEKVRAAGLRSLRPACWPAAPPRSARLAGSHREFAAPHARFRSASSTSRAPSSSTRSSVRGTRASLPRRRR